MSFGAQELYFLPDAALFIDRRSVAALHYRDITVAQQSTNFIEDEHVPKDATVVGHTWRFVNKNGGPDRRFNNNRQIPICLYSQLDFFSEGGLNGCMHLSNSTAGATLAEVIGVLGSIVGDEQSIRPISSYRRPKRWPTVAFVASAVTVGIGLLATSALHEPSNLRPPSAPDRAESAHVNAPLTKDHAPNTTKVTPTPPTGGPLVIIPPGASSSASGPQGLAPLPRPNPLRP